MSQDEDRFSPRDWPRNALTSSLPPSKIANKPDRLSRAGECG
jgi:hypothetical protein